MVVLATPTRDHAHHTLWRKADIGTVHTARSLVTFHTTLVAEALHRGKVERETTNQISSIDKESINHTTDTDKETTNQITDIDK